jgi:hypothetical protein
MCVRFCVAACCRYLKAKWGYRSVLIMDACDPQKSNLSSPSTVHIFLSIHTSTTTRVAHRSVSHELFIFGSEFLDLGQLQYEVSFWQHGVYENNSRFTRQTVRSYV